LEFDGLTPLLALAIVRFLALHIFKKPNLEIRVLRENRGARVIFASQPLLAVKNEWWIVNLTRRMDPSTGFSILGAQASFENRQKWHFFLKKCHFFKKFENFFNSFKTPKICLFRLF